MSHETEIETMQYENLKTAYEAYFSEKENIVATRQWFISIEKRGDEEIDKLKERVERAGRIGRFGGLLDDMVVQVVIMGMTSEKIR